MAVFEKSKHPCARKINPVFLDGSAGLALLPPACDFQSISGCLMKFSTLCLVGVISVSSLLAGRPLRAAVLHAVIAYDRNDKLVNDAVQHAEIEGFLSAHIVARDLKRIAIPKESMTERGIRGVIEQIGPQPEDSILFYYIGHGRFHEQLQATCLSLTNDPNAAFSWRDVTAAIRQTGCRFTVVIFDCCNRDDRNRGQRGLAFALAPRVVPKTSPLCEELFFKPSGEMFICSSSPSEYALVKAVGPPNERSQVPDGAIFTSALGKRLSENSSRSLSWKSLMNRTQDLVDIYFDEMTQGTGQFTLGGKLTVQRRQTIRVVDQTR
jgi:hypothetical protein